jgi:hypothetical protein
MDLPHRKMIVMPAKLPRWPLIISSGFAVEQDRFSLGQVSDRGTG